MQSKHHTREWDAPHKDTQYTHSFSLFSFFIMSLSVALNLLAQGNNGDEILTILNTLVADIEQEGINSCAEVFEVWI